MKFHEYPTTMIRVFQRGFTDMKRLSFIASNERDFRNDFNYQIPWNSGQDERNSSKQTERPNKSRSCILQLIKQFSKYFQKSYSMNIRPLVIQVFHADSRRDKYECPSTQIIKQKFGKISLLNFMKIRILVPNFSTLADGRVKYNNRSTKLNKQSFEKFSNKNISWKSSYIPSIYTHTNMTNLLIAFRN